jgi:hypothetical protein
LEFTLFKTGSAMSINVRENRRGKSRYTDNIVVEVKSFTKMYGLKSDL